MDDKIMQLKQWIDESDNVVFFGGADKHPAYFVADARPNGNRRHASMLAEQGNPVQNRNTAGRPAVL